MKSVWLFNHYAQEPGGPGGTRHFSIAKHLKHLDWDMSIIAASVELNTNRQRIQDHILSKIEYYAGVRFLWLKTPTYAGNGFQRLMNMISYSILATLPFTTRALPRPEIVVGSSVHPFAAIAGAFTAKRFAVPFVFEVRDLWPQTLIDLGRIRSGSLVARLMKRIERWLYMEAEKIIVLLPKAVDYIAPIGIDAQKVQWIPNGVDLEAFPYTPIKPQKPHAPFSLMYFGAHGSANGLETLIRAMLLVQNTAGVEAIQLRLIGDGPLKKSLVDKARQMGIKNISFEPPVSKDLIPKTAAEADAFVFNLIDAPVFKFGISSNKLFDFLAAGRPIIFCCSSANNPVEEANAGLTARPGDPEALATAILKISALNYDEVRNLGANAREYVEKNNSFTTLARKFAETLNEVHANFRSSS